MQRLEQLEITKVALVPEGDNKQADILLFKSKPQGQGEPPQSTPPDDEQARETRTLKRFFLALAKSLGFDVEKDNDDDTKKDDGQGEGDGGGDGAGEKPSGTPAVSDQEGKEPGEDEEPTGKNKTTAKGVTKDMKFDKSKLTAEELAQLEAIEKKAGVPEDGGEGETKPQDNGVAKGNQEGANGGEGAGSADEDIYKGLHLAVAAELKELRKRVDAAEEQELLEVAKKYELLGKKPEELAKTFKSLKAAGNGSYEEMIAILDTSLNAVEKSGVFGEVGKSGHGGKADAWTQIEQHASEIQKAAPTMTWNQAVDKACEQHPELVAEYESNR
ncbi:MAG: hypothetical protein LUE24_03040 [Lachnospiraceae bacterium]|nr:hypothetical protein [Lachnospiraceae bacterium]MCD8196135.1 hypothetical protein [Lachnospiraceae bacterium]